MKRHIVLAIAATLAVASPFTMAAVDATVAKLSDRFSQEPVASAATPSTDDGLATGIVQALNADASMKNAKITVQPEKGVVYLTGAALTKEQKQKAAGIAAAQAGEGNVVNTILDDET